MGLVLIAVCRHGRRGRGILRLPVFVILFVSFFGGPLLVPLVVLAAVTAYILVFDKPELVGSPPEKQTTVEPGDLGGQPAAAGR